MLNKHMVPSLFASTCMYVFSIPPSGSLGTGFFGASLIVSPIHPGGIAKLTKLLPHNPYLLFSIDKSVPRCETILKLKSPRS
jgi:hypothetical protein